MRNAIQNSGKEAFNLYQALIANNQIEIKSNIVLFSKYINCLCETKFPKALNEKFIFQWTFKNVFDLKEREYECYCKTNLITANQSLQRIVAKYNSIQLNEYQIRLITDFICDLKPFITKFDSTQHYDWLLGNTNSHISNFYFDLLSNTFWNGNIGGHPEEKLVLGTSTPFFIRQTIEYKIKRVLGIDYILIDRKLDIRSMEKFFKAIEANEIFYVVKFEFDILKTIFSWTHTYIHGGYRAEPWKTETAIHYLESIFYSGQTSNINSFSIYAGVEVDRSKLEELRINTENTIKTLAEKENKTVDIYWINKPEVAVVN